MLSRAGLHEPVPLSPKASADCSLCDVLCRGKPVRQEDGSQQDTALPAAASSAGRRSRPSSAGNKQATDTAKAPAQITAQMPAPTASVAVGPPALSFVPQSTITPAAALQQPG